jgi:hypothetical protein
MKKFLLFTFFISLPVLAKWTDKVKTHLPPNLQTLELGKTDRQSARKILGNPDLVRGDKEYWVMDGFKYAVELTYINNRLKSLHYNFPKKKLNIDALKSEIDPKLLKSSPTAPHTNLLYQDKTGKLEVELTSGDVESVRFQ